MSCIFLLRCDRGTSAEGQFYTDEVLLTYNGESVSVSTSSSQYCPGMREEHCEASHLTAAE